MQTAITSPETTITSFTPCETLRAFVERFLIVEYPLGHADSHLPGTGFVAAFRLDGDCVINAASRAPDVSVTGLWDTARTHAHSRGHRVALILFTPVGASALLRQSMEELSNTTASLEDLVDHPAELRQLHSRIVEAADHRERFKLLETFLLRRIAHVRPDVLIAAAVNWLTRAPAGARIEELVRHIGLSQSALERRFRQRIGCSPKKFASLLRLGRVAQLRRAGHDLTSIAHAAGYFDQPHFIRDFRRFAGCAPEAYFG